MSDTTQPRKVFEKFAEVVRKNRKEPGFPFTTTQDGRMVIVDWRALFGSSTVGSSTVGSSTVGSSTVKEATPVSTVKEVVSVSTVKEVVPVSTVSTVSPVLLDDIAAQGLFQFFDLLRVFESVLFRASPFFSELFWRRVADLSIQHWGAPPPPRHVELTEREEAILRGYYKRIYSDELTVARGIASSANATLASYVPKEAKSMSHRAARAAPGTFAVDLSVFNIDPTYFLSDDYADDKVILKDVHYPGFAPGNLNPFMTELTIARDMARYVVAPSQQTGVVLIKPTPTMPLAPKVIAVNLARFYSYRAVRTKRYDSLVSRKAQKSAVKVADALRAKYEAATPLLKRLHKAYKDAAFCEAYLVGEGRLCETPEEWANTILLASDAFDWVLDAYQRVEKRTCGMRAKSGPKRNADNRSFIDTYVDPVTNENHQFIFCTYDTKQVYVSPSWYVPESAVTEARSGGRRCLLNGVKIFQGFPGRFFFTYKRIFELENSPIALISGIRTWLEKYMVGETQQAVRKIRGGTSMHYAPAEDEAILNFYRRGMTKDDWAELEKACPGRKRISITLRARELCKSLVLGGERDLSKLPMQRRTGEFLKWFRKVKEG